MVDQCICIASYMQDFTFKTVNFILFKQCLAEFGCNLCWHSIQSTAFFTVPVWCLQNDTNGNNKKINKNLKTLKGSSDCNKK